MLRLALVGDNNGRFVASDANIVVTGVDMSSIVFDDILRDIEDGNSVLVFSKDRKRARLAIKIGYVQFMYACVKFVMDDGMTTKELLSGDRYIASSFLSRVEASEQEDEEEVNDNV